MRTKVWTFTAARAPITGDAAFFVNPAALAAIAEAAELLRAGELVAFPTETVYGLGGDALNAAAALKIFAAKGRPADNPLIAHVADAEGARALSADWTPLAERLACEFWPGPLTLVTPAAARVPREVTAGLSTVAIRMPAHPVARRLCAALRRPIAAPSANRSGRPSPTLAAHVLEDMDGTIAGVIDGGACAVGVESTVLDVTDAAEPTILRPGGITREALERFLGLAVADRSAGAGGTDGKPRAPGMKYTHYAPRAPLWMAAGEAGAQLAQLRAAAARAGAGETVVIICSDETAEALTAGGEGPAFALTALEAGRHGGARQAAGGGRRAIHVLALGGRERPEELSARLFAALRRCDELGAGLILAESYPETEMGAALMNRLRKAAGGKTLDGEERD